ncbi:hypothetical protein C7N43_04610 [Sphingobacteriales bacterium UPWRP_1]|nr:hypothetical protein BVG80_07210 [Sphingobacteriales bacterium TSM_CSM]PSJ78219.1 hypothetical protein C7N43_04610 [Sphingobacteriales bacterium UPWRP_1]
MKGNLFFRAIRFLLLIVLGLTLAGFVVMWLWNAILHPVISVGTLNFWQALGLLVLCRLLFGNWGGNRRRHSPYWRKKIMLRKKWATMTPDERQEFKRQWKAYCGKEQE